MALSKSTLLLYYKRKDIREAMASGTQDKEVAVRYNEGFGKRPDMVTSPQDILEMVQRGATSFHSSEELWTNPMQLSPALSKKELEGLRKGWDLVLDIDCPIWELAKLTTKLIIKALRDNGVKKSVSVKFSGNKGFHIGVPFEAFPSKVNYKGDLKNSAMLFPEPTRRIAQYLVDYVANQYIKVDDDNVFFQDKKYTLTELKKLTGKSDEELKKTTCEKCKKTIKQKQDLSKTEFICPKCDTRTITHDNEQYKKCDNCNAFMQRIEHKKSLCECGSNKTKTKFNPLSIVEVDTILISSRHLYRTEFSMHEKSGLVSVPFNPDKIDSFQKTHADPKKAKVSKFKFLSRENAVKGEAKQLFLNAYDYTPEIEVDDSEIKRLYEKRDFSDENMQAIPEELFPPCIKKGLEGLEDGKKRFLFVLTNFLYSAGWEYEAVEKRVREWNDKNREPLKEQVFMGHLRYAKTRQEKALPPNCDNKMYYQDFQICFREYDNLCQKIKNPVQYSKRKVWAQTHGKKPRKRKETPSKQETKEKTDSKKSKP